MIHSAAKALLALTILAVTLTPMASPQQTLSTLVDRNRVLLLFAPASTDPRLGQQLDAFHHHEAELRTRDLILIPLTLENSPPIASDTLRLLQPPRISDEEQITIRRRFHIAQNEFAVILIGKDGGEKLRSTTPITLQRLNRTIDAMPGRQEEMRHQN